jgi:hypothetical protein
MSDPTAPRPIFAPRPGTNPYDVSTWGPECGKGIRYHDVGAPVASGTKGVVRKITTGRKSHRGLASEELGITPR